MKKTTHNYVINIPFFIILILLIQPIAARSSDDLSSTMYNCNQMASFFGSNYKSKESVLKPNFWLPALETFGANIAVWYVNRYVRNKEWADISATTIWNNITHGFVWDSDGFEVNQLSHPYSGALSFTAARSNGLNFWQSVLYPFGGSLMWELTMETEYPSINDIITTSTSGIVLGEISYRISSLIVGNGNDSMLEKAVREIGAAVTCPMNGINRLMTCRTMRKGYGTVESPFTIFLFAGLNGMFKNGRFSERQPNLYFKYKMEYGDLRDISLDYKPFDYFETNVGASFSTENYIVIIFATGMIWGRNITLFGSKWGNFGVYESFDFLDNNVYKISSTSTGIGFSFSHKLLDRISWSNTFILSGIMMGGINSIYASEVGRNYNLGPGLNVKIESVINVKDFMKLFFRYRNYRFYILSGASGNDYVDIYTTGIKLNISRNIFIGGDYIRYNRYSHYKNYPDISDYNSALRVYMGLHLRSKS